MTSQRDESCWFSDWTETLLGWRNTGGILTVSSGLLLNNEGDDVKEEMSDRKAIFKGKWEDVKERAKETVRF